MNFLVIFFVFKGRSDDNSTVVWSKKMPKSRTSKKWEAGQGGFEDFQSRSRRDFAKQLKPRGKKHNGIEIDVEHIAQSIRAILVTNKEIWERCEQSLQTDEAEDSFQVSVTRLSYSTVKAWTVPHEKTIQFITAPEKSTETFDVKPLMKLPDNLTRIFEPYFKGGNSEFLNLEEYFERSLILHDEVLGPFLYALKNHLEKVQVSLGKIDSWLMESARALDFIKTTFDIQLPLEVPSEDESEEYESEYECDDNETCEHPHFPHEICLLCSRTRKMHHGKFDDGCYFLHTPYEVLMECTSEGLHEKDFNIEFEADQMKLKKFIEFITL